MELEWLTGFEVFRGIYRCSEVFAGVGFFKLGLQAFKLV